MNKRVEEFLADSESRLDRNQILIEAGLYDKIYMPETDDGNSCNGESLRCDYPESEYDEEKGDPEKGIAPGTKWEDIPDDFTCPLCGVAKDMFEKAE